VLSNGEYILAYQGSNSHLWTETSSGALKDWGLTMRAKSSPSIVALAEGGYEIAFQAAGGEMTVTGTNGTTNTAQGMAAETSPSISAPTRWNN
jgi:hypothetical protein